MIPFEQTRQLQMPNRLVNVLDLPSNFQKEVLMYDEIRQQQQKLLIQLEILTLALHTQHGKITALADAFASDSENRTNEVPTEDGTS